MSVALIVVIVVGGTLLVIGAVVGFLVLNNRSVSAQRQGALERLQHEVEARGWVYVPRDDRYTEMYNTRHNDASPLHPFTPPPRAHSARDVITGTHRGRPFLAATFDVTQRGEHVSVGAVWVFTPTPRPSLSVTKTFALQSTVNEAIGRDMRTGDPGFDRAFEVTTADPRFAAAVLTPPLTQYLLAETRDYRGWWIQRDYLDIIHPLNDHRDPAELIPALDFRCDILDHIPHQAWA